MTCICKYSFREPSEEARNITEILCGVYACTIFIPIKNKCVDIECHVFNWRSPEKSFEYLLMMIKLQMAGRAFSRSIFIFITVLAYFHLFLPVTIVKIQLDSVSASVCRE